MPIVISNYKINSNILNGKKRKIYKLIKQTIEKHKKKTGNITIVITTKPFLLKLNKKFLNHNYHTDIITFNYNSQNVISGDLFISLTKVCENAKLYNKTNENELIRVIGHGILHLLNYNDKTEKETKIIRKKEDEFLNLFYNKKNNNE